MQEDIIRQIPTTVQHALRAFTDKDQKDLRLAAQNYRPNPRFAIEDAIREVGTGEAVTSFLELKGIPGVAERTLVRPPSSRLGPCDEAARAAAIAGSPVAGKYDTAVDRDSAWEMLRRRADEAARNAETPPAPQGGGLQLDLNEFRQARRYDGKGYGRAEPEAPKKRSAGRQSDSITEAFAKSFARQLGTKGGQAVVRGIFGTLFGRK